MRDFRLSPVQWKLSSGMDPDFSRSERLGVVDNCRDSRPSTAGDQKLDAQSLQRVVYASSACSIRSSGFERRQIATEVIAFTTR